MVDRAEQPDPRWAAVVACVAGHLLGPIFLLAIVNG